MAAQKIDIKETIVAGVQYGMKNIVNLLLMVLLYVVTVWIPYLNIGTTIGLYKAIIKIGKGEVINPTEIFAKENFENLGDFFLLLGFLSIGISMAAVFMFIPAIVIGIAWQFAIYFFIDKGLSPTKALKVSYKATYGEKWRIFFIYIILYIAIAIICCILGLIPKVGGILAALATICCLAIVVAIEGVMYKHFSDKADEIFADKIAACCCKEAPEAPAAPAEEAPEAE
ncbi:MAG: hypothetical protein J5771_05230 [Bacteroidales bacterium]|nr:hypothetical protein [Bacteroidales bacterium]